MYKMDPKGTIVFVEFVFFFSFFLFPAERATVLTVWRGALNKSVRLEIKGGLASPPPLHVVGGREQSRKSKSPTKIRSF